MIVRAVSALAALPVALWLMYLGGWVFAGLGLGVGAIILYEFMEMTMPRDGLARLVFVLVGVSLIFFMLTGRLASASSLVAFSALPMLSTTLFLLKTGDMDTVAQRMGFGVTGVVWAGGLLGATCALRLLDDGFAWIFLACTLAWGSDTGAYFVGRAVGRHKLYAKVSPGKTWEGAVGGVLTATAMAFGFRELLGPDIETLHLAIVAPLGAIMGQVGDLAESMLKRSVGVKDSGRIMPGHGGLLDRVDALIFVGPTVLAYAVLVLDMKLQWLPM